MATHTAVYSFSFNNPERMKRMNHRFESVGYPIHWIPPVLTSDVRIPTDETSKRTYAIMLNHLDMIMAFLGSKYEYGVFCEDDIYIRRDFATQLDAAIDGYNRHSLDVLLLGYLMNYTPLTFQTHYSNTLLETPLSFMSYEDGLWGSQMYMMNKAAARKVVEAFQDSSSVKAYYSPDWTITKFGRRAIVYPMLAVEEGNVVTDHVGQAEFHKQCTAIHYDPKIHI
jgi:GR25 family glycosyltransferase involved in LPS biosynthesis